MNIKNIRLWFNVQTHKIRSTCGVSHHFSYANPKKTFLYNICSFNQFGFVFVS